MIIKKKLQKSWQVLIERFTESFFQFYFPEVYPKMDCGLPFMSLDRFFNEKNLPIDKKNSLYAGLFSFHLSNGKEVVALINIQNPQYDSEFVLRSFHNYCLLKKHFPEKEIAIFAVITDDNFKYNESFYTFNLLFTEIEFRFPIVKIIDFQNKEFELSNDLNPFALITLATIKSLESGRNYEKVAYWKYKILVMLWQRSQNKFHYELKIIADYIDTVFVVPERLNNKILQVIYDMCKLDNSKRLRNEEKIYG